MRRELMPHQERAKAYARETTHPFFAMEMRLGKSLTVIRTVAEDYCPAGTTRILWVGPATTLIDAERELRTEGENVLLLYGQKAQARADVIKCVNNHSGSRVWLLVNYELIRQYSGLADLGWDVVIADESTRIKNPQASITKLFVRGFRQARHRICMSGLPTPESPAEIFTQMQFLQGGFMGHTSFWSWRHAYFQQVGYEWIPYKGEEKAIQDAFRQKAFVLTRHQAGCGSRKLYQRRVVEMPAVARKLYVQAEKDFAVGEQETNWQLVLETWLGRMAGGFLPDGTLLFSAKADELLWLLTGELERQQVVVWFRFNAELDYVKSRLDEIGLKSSVIYGETDADSRKRAIEGFRAQKFRVLLGQIACAKYGVDCSTADTAIYYSNAYSCENRMQSEDRIVHPKKDVPLLYIDLVTKGTVDADVVDRLRDKSINAKLFMVELLRSILARNQK